MRMVLLSDDDCGDVAIGTLLQSNPLLWRALRMVRWLWSSVAPARFDGWRVVPEFGLQILL